MKEKLDNVLFEAVNFAIQMENDGIEFFRKAAARTTNQFGKVMFLSFVEDEKEHIRRIKMMTAGLVEPESAVDEYGHSPRERLKTIFKDMQSSIADEIPAEASDLDAIKVSLNIERKVYKFYEVAARESLSVREKELYKFLAKEEIIHFQILKNAYTHLSNISKWNVKSFGKAYEEWLELIRDRDPRYG